MLPVAEEEVVVVVPELVDIVGSGKREYVDFFFFGARSNTECVMIILLFRFAIADPERSF